VPPAAPAGQLEALVDRHPAGVLDEVDAGALLNASWEFMLHGRVPCQ